MTLEVGDIILCTVDRIVGTIVFVKIDSSGKEGSIMFSEISPGRIRNIRDFVVPKKKIICKVLRVSGDRIDLSLRRVTPKEQKEVREKMKHEKSCKSVLRSVLGKNSDEIIKKIQEKESVYSFCEKAKEDIKVFEKIVGKENAKKISEILKTEKQKKTVVKKEIKLHSESPEGLKQIKNLLNSKEIDIKYISAGTYSLRLEGTEIKKTDQKLREFTENVEKKAKKQGMTVEIKKK